MNNKLMAGAKRWSSGAIVMWVMVSVVSTASAHVPAQDDSIEAARSALAAGNWQEAAELGEATGTAAGWAVAVDALSIHAHYVAPGEEAEALLQRAMQLAEEAVLLDPTDPEVRFRLAHAVGAICAVRFSVAGVCARSGEPFA